MAGASESVPEVSRGVSHSNLHMKGVVLADGSGTRSYSITKGISKLMMMARLENMLFGNENESACRCSALVAVA